MQYATNLYKERHSISRKIFPWAAFWFLNDIICSKSSTETDIQLQERFSPRSALWFLQDIMCSKFFCKKRYIVFMKRFPQDLPLRCYVQQILYKKKKIYRIQERLPVLWASYSYIVYLYIVLVKMLNQQFKDSPHEPPFLTQWLQCKETELVSCKQRFSSFDQMSTLTWILIFRRNVHFACHWFNHQRNIVSNKTYMCFES